MAFEWAGASHRRSFWEWELERGSSFLGVGILSHGGHKGSRWGMESTIFGCTGLDVRVWELREEAKPA
jgi:hypothetical protein